MILYAGAIALDERKYTKPAANNLETRIFLCSILFMCNNLRFRTRSCGLSLILVYVFFKIGAIFYISTDYTSLVQSKIKQKLENRGHVSARYYWVWVLKCWRVCWGVAVHNLGETCIVSSCVHMLLHNQHVHGCPGH